MPKLIFHPDVASEIKDSYNWYQEKLIGLGEDFINELELAYQTIVEFPKTWPKFQKGFRRYLLPRFPFSVIYRQENNQIYIVAIMHNSRMLGDWLNRT